MMEYLEDLPFGDNLLPLGDPQLRAHCRLWVDHIDRKILPPFYALLLTPPGPKATDNNGTTPQNAEANPNASPIDTIGSPGLTEEHHMLIGTLSRGITSLVNASHQTGPFFLGDRISYVDVAFAPWIIRLSRVLSRFRSFPRAEIGTRWRVWVDAIENDKRVRATVSDEGSYHNVYCAVGQDGYEAFDRGKKGMVEREYAKRLVRSEGFGLGGDIWGRTADDHIALVPESVVEGGMHDY